MGLLWIGVPEGRNAARAPGVATLVLLDRRPLQFPPFAEGTGLGRLVLCLCFVFYPVLFLSVPSSTEKRGNCCGLVSGKG